MSRWTDPAGHDWPVTGHVCTVCGLPLIRSTHMQETHPNCTEEATQ